VKLEGVFLVRFTSPKKCPKTCQRICNQEQRAEQFALPDVNLLMRTQNSKQFMTLADDHMAESNGSKRVLADPARHLLLTVADADFNGMTNPANAPAKQQGHNSRNDRKQGAWRRPEKAKQTNEPDVHAGSGLSVARFIKKCCIICQIGFHTSQPNHLEQIRLTAALHRESWTPCIRHTNLYWPQSGHDICHCSVLSLS